MALRLFDMMKILRIITLNLTDLSATKDGVSAAILQMLFCIRVTNYVMKYYIVERDAQHRQVLGSVCQSLSWRIHL